MLYVSILRGSAAFKVGEIDDVMEILQTGLMSTDFAANVQSCG